MTDPNRAPKGGGAPVSTKKKHGRGWRKARDRRLSWAARKTVSRRYCRGTKA